MHKEIIKVDDTVIIEDEKGIKRELKDKTNLEDVLVIENNIEYLECNKEYLTKEISNLTADIESSKTAIESTKMLRIVSVFIVFFISIFASVLIDTTSIVRILVAIITPTLTYGITELYLYIEKVLIKQNEENKNKYELALSFIEKDLEREKEKLKTKVTYKKPSFQITKVDKKELYDYKKRYDALINSGEIEEKPKTKKHEFRH